MEEVKTNEKNTMTKAAIILLAVTMDVGYEVEKLKVGDRLVGYDENVTIVSIEQRPEIENYDTYNLSIDGEYHNYIVEGIVVHNASGGGGHGSCYTPMPDQ